MRAQRILTILLAFLLFGQVSSAPAAENIYLKNFRAIAHVIDAEYYKPVDFQKCTGAETIRAIAQSKDETTFAKHLKKAMKRCLDPHSRYVSSRDIEFDNQNLSGSFGGVGLELFQNKKNGEIMILGIIPGNSADGSGIREGDVIVQVGEHKLVKKTKVDDVVEWIRGPIGTEVMIRVRRADIGQALPFLLARRQVVVETVFDYATLSPAIGYLHISQFTPGTSVRLLQKMENAGMQRKQGMIFDLRNDPGGLLDEAVCVVALFARDKEYKVVAEYHRSKEQLSEKAGSCKSLPQGFYETPRRVMPMVVLVNEQSASAAEIVAANLQELGFTIVGSKHTYKKGTIQGPFGWWYGIPFGRLWLTVAEYRTGEHERVVDGVGVRVDVEVANPEKKDAASRPPFRSQRKPDFSGDPQLQKAFEILQKQIMK